MDKVQADQSSTTRFLVSSTFTFEPGSDCSAHVVGDVGWPCGLWVVPGATLRRGSFSGEAPGLLHPRLQGSSAVWSRHGALPARGGWLRPRWPWDSGRAPEAREDHVSHVGSRWQPCLSFIPLGLAQQVGASPLLQTCPLPRNEGDGRVPGSELSLRFQMQNGG